MLRQRSVNLDVRIACSTIEHNRQAVLRIDCSQIRDRHAAAVADMHVCKHAARKDRILDRDIGSVNACRICRIGDTAVRDRYIIITNNGSSIIIVAIFAGITCIHRAVHNGIIHCGISQADNAESLAADIGAGAVDLEAVAVYVSAVQRQRRIPVGACADLDVAEQNDVGITIQRGALHEVVSVYDLEVEGVMCTLALTDLNRYRTFARELQRGLCPVGSIRCVDALCRASRFDAARRFRIHARIGFNAVDLDLDIGSIRCAGAVHLEQAF